MKGQKTGGRAQGTPNKATQDVRSAIAVFALANVPKIGQWLNEVEDPAKRLDLYLRALEYHIPKLQRTELSGKDGDKLVVNLNMTDANAL